MKKQYVAAITVLLFAVALIEVQADSHEAGESQEIWEHYIETFFSYRLRFTLLDWWLRVQ